MDRDSAERHAMNERGGGTMREGGADAREAAAFERLENAVTAISARLREVQLPLHILLSSPFGELNENQEELLAAASDATDAADLHLRRLAKLLDLERGAMAMMPEPISVQDLLRPALAIAVARAKQRRIDVQVHIPDSAPRVVVDPVHAQEALSAILTSLVNGVPERSAIVVDAAEDESGGARIVINHEDAAVAQSLEQRLATRLIEAQHGRVCDERGRTTIELPR
jgi:signal transduction histidine kinase